MPHDQHLGIRQVVAVPHHERGQPARRKGHAAVRGSGQIIGYENNGDHRDATICSATSIAASKLVSRAFPVPAMSNAVP